MNAFRTFLFSLAVTVTAACQASHIRGGELRYEYVGTVPGGIVYNITAFIYSDPSGPADIPELLINIDGLVDTVQRTALVPMPSACPTERSTYEVTRVFPGTGVYHITVVATNRTPGFVNIPNSVDVPLSLSALLNVVANGQNSSPVFNAPVTDLIYSWSTLVHDPQVTDPDGDSLSFELVTCLGADLNSDGIGDPIPGYLLPDVATGPGDFTWIDPATGVFLWDQPNMMGYFQIAILCTERRLINGTWTVIGHVTGISDTASTETLILTPLGSYGLFTITSATRFAEVHVLDATGRLVVLQGTTPNGMLDLSGLTSGTYVVTLRSASGSASSRVALIR